MSRAVFCSRANTARWSWYQNGLIIPWWNTYRYPCQASAWQNCGRANECPPVYQYRPLIWQAKTTAALCGPDRPRRFVEHLPKKGDTKSRTCVNGTPSVDTKRQNVVNKRPFCVTKPGKVVTRRVSVDTKYRKENNREASCDNAKPSAVTSFKKEVNGKAFVYIKTGGNRAATSHKGILLHRKNYIFKGFGNELLRCFYSTV